jgi:eukaryotic-like serine/threonine-protein kinase
MLGSDHLRIGVREGDILAGKYRVDRVLGTGGMGVVVAARHMKLDERVAIKFLHPDALENAEAVARFDREARAAVKIKSEHVARVLDVGTLDNGAPYMIMEYLDGEDLSQWLQARGPFAVDQVIEFVLQACEAIAEAHGLGIVHRDLKPSNLFCVRRADGLLSIKVLDFGISKLTGGASGGMDMTRTGAVMGSPLYMSPEQMKSARSVDARTDIWAIGVILYELLTGRAPFQGDTFPEVCMNVSTQRTPSVRRVRNDLPVGLEIAIGRCLEKERERRFANVAELAFALAPFAPKRARSSVDRISRVISSSGLAVSAISLPPSSDTAPSSSTTNAPWGRTAGTFRQRAGLLGLVATAIVGFSVVAIRWLQPQDRSSAANPPQSAAPPVAEAVPVVAAQLASASTDPAMPWNRTDSGATGVSASTPAPSASSSPQYSPPTLAVSPPRPPPIQNRPNAPASAVAAGRPAESAPTSPAPAPTGTRNRSDLGGRL